MGRLSVGIVDFLNSRPLAWGFLEGRYSHLFEPVFLPPSGVARRMAEGTLDIGLLPTAELQRQPGTRLLPDLCIASVSEVRSVLLVMRTPLEAIRRVALDTASRTSAVLVQILLAERYGLHPEYLPLAPPLEGMLERCEAALLIGDPALKVDRARYRILDLAAEWHALTGLPFVFAAWTVGPGVEGPGDLAEYFRDSFRRGLASLAQVVERSAAELGLDPAEVEAYLTDNLSFQLGADEVASLREFFLRAHRRELLPPPREVELWRSPAASRP